MAGKNKGALLVTICVTNMVYIIALPISKYSNSIFALTLNVNHIFHIYNFLMCNFSGTLLEFHLLIKSYILLIFALFNDFHISELLLFLRIPKNS